MADSRQFDYPLVDGDKLGEVLISPERLRQRIAELGQEITEAYDPTERIHAICILKGGIIFMADLVRAIHRPVSMDFMAVSSYGQDTRSSGKVRILKDLEEDIEGKNLLIVEDIIDTGLTLTRVVDLLRSRGPASVKICTLLDKPSGRDPQTNLSIDFCGFKVPPSFIVGYGLDYREYYRNVPCIFTLDNS